MNKFNIIIILLPFIIFGCDIFNTREAKSPDSPRENFLPPTSTEILITNFINSLSDKSVESYVNSLTDSIFYNGSFSFSPSSGAALQFPALADNWNKKNEEKYITDLFRAVTNQQISLTFSNSSTTPYGDSTVFISTYNLSVSFNDPTIPNNYQGELRFTMVRDSRSYWSIFYWQDSKNSDLPSWSELKGRFY